MEPKCLVPFRAFERAEDTIIADAGGKEINNCINGTKYLKKQRTKMAVIRFRFGKISN